jgi:nucleoside-diphosphate kinase
METTLVLIKPGGVQRRLIGVITSRIEARGLQVSALKMLRPDRALVEEHYAEHRGKAFFESVVGYLCSGTVVAMAISGTNAVRAARTMMGATDPIDAEPGTIRGDFALSIEENLTHSSSDSEAAAREVSLWFPEGLAG